MIAYGIVAVAVTIDSTDQNQKYGIVNILSHFATAFKTKTIETRIYAYYCHAFFSVRCVDAPRCRLGVI